MQENLDMMGVIVLVLVFSTGAVISIGIVGLQLRAKLKAIEVLKVYAERGEEPPGERGRSSQSGGQTTCAAPTATGASPPRLVSVSFCGRGRSIARRLGDCCLARARLTPGSGLADDSRDRSRHIFRCSRGSTADRRFTRRWTRMRRSWHGSARVRIERSTY